MAVSFFSRFKRNAREDFDREVLPHLDALYAMALRLTRNERDAEDLVQDAALRAFRFFHRFEAGTNCRAWLFKILHNTFLTKYRRRVREREMVDAFTDECIGAEVHATSVAADPETQLGATLLSDDVRRALELLPEDFRAAVVLCDLEEFSYKEIAEILDCPVGTVMSRLHRGRRMLQEQLREFATREGIVKGPAVGTPEEESVGANVIPLRRGGDA